MWTDSWSFRMLALKPGRELGCRLVTEITTKHGPITGNYIFTTWFLLFLSWNFTIAIQPTFSTRNFFFFFFSFHCDCRSYQLWVQLMYLNLTMSIEAIEVCSRKVETSQLLQTELWIYDWPWWSELWSAVLHWEAIKWQQSGNNRQGDVTWVVLRRRLRGIIIDGNNEWGIQQMEIHRLWVPLSISYARTGYCKERRKCQWMTIDDYFS